jgi:hypothetical protein
MMIGHLVRAALGCLALAPLAHPQTLIHTWQGTFDGFGRGLDGVGDVNGDGFDDVAIGEAATTPFSASNVQVFSGEDGSKIWKFDPQQPLSVGQSVASAGDLDLDGINDVLTGEPLLALSGKDGRVLYRIYRKLNVYHTVSFGEVITSYADVDGDGVREVIAGAPSEGLSPFYGHGFASAFSGRTGKHLYDVPWTNVRSMSGGGDVNGDGIADVAIVSGYVSPNQGFLKIVSGDDGHVVRLHQGLDIAVAMLGDVDGDGLEDYAATGDRYFGTNQVGVFSGGSGSTLMSIRTPGSQFTIQFGSTLAGVGDVDLDGVPDLLIGDPYTGTVYLVSGSSGSLLTSIKGPSSFGFAIAAAGDVNQDGRPDIAVSQPGTSYPPPGRVYVYSYP